MKTITKKSHYEVLNKTKKQEIRDFYSNKANWILTPPSYGKMAKKFGVGKSYVFKILN